MATLDVRITNNATGSLSAGIDAVVTSLDVKGGEGALFPLTTNALYFYVTIQGEDGAWEIVKVTERATDTFTIERNVDSSTGAAQAFAADDIVSLRPCQAIHDDIVDWINDTNGATLIIPAPAGTAMIFYQAAAPPGWTIDAAVADAVIAVAGGANAYNVAAGQLVGTWTQPNHDHTFIHTHELDHIHEILQAALEHNHQWLDVKAGNDGTYDTDGNVINFDKAGSSGDNGVVTDADGDKVMGADSFTDLALDAGNVSSEQPDDATTDSQSTDDSGAAATVNTYRPYAALSICATRDA